VIDGRRILAVIPARGGSEGVPRKNVRPLAGKPLVCHTVETAITVDGLDLVVVSTDDDEIKTVSEAAGARVIDRPAALATDEASTEIAVLHALDNLEEDGEAFDVVVVLEPTSPFRSAATVRACIDTLVARNGDSLLAVKETRDVIGHLDDGIFRLLVPGGRRRRQEREPLYVEASTVYVARVDFLRRTGSLVTGDWLAYVVPEREAIDINTTEDFAYAEFLATGARSPE
jgi:CMP-N,N'-diacetyllegionaminic acid synthase